MIRAAAIALCNRTLQAKQVLLLRSRISFMPVKFCSTIRLPATQRNQNNCTHIDLSSIDCSGIAQSLILRHSLSIEKKEKILTLAHHSLNDFLFEISDVVPGYARRFRRISELKPTDVLELLIGFQSEVENVGIQVRKVECLWGIFRLTSEKFRHLQMSCEVMASLLIRVGKLEEVQLLLSKMEIEGISLDNPEIFSRLTESFVSEGNVEGAILTYEKLRNQCMIPSVSCCYVLLDSLVQMKKTQLALRVCLDMLEMGSGLSDEFKVCFENFIRLLCLQGKVLEARKLVKKFVGLGFKSSNEILYEITSGYCKKKDFEDLLSFFFEIKCPPDCFSGNKIIHSLCKSFGSESANLYLQELEHIGFRPDETTFGILICWSCCAGNLRNALIYFSDLSLNGLKPDLHSYNALISGMMKEGLWKQAQGVFDEMVDEGTSPNLLTFRILLAGYCKARRFDEAKNIVIEMEKCGLIQLSSTDDPLCRVFCFLGLNPLAVKLKRDNNIGVSKTEFFDTLGNGLYLEGDIDEYDRRIIEVIEESTPPDFNSLIIKECKNGDLNAALNLVAEMARWGQELSSMGFTSLVKSRYKLSSNIKSLSSILEKKPHLIAQLGAETLNFILQACSKKGLTSSGLRILNEMIQMRVKIEKTTYASMIKSLCKMGNLSYLLDCWGRAQIDGWIPESHDCKSLVRYLCKEGKLKEIFFLFESMLLSYPQQRLDIIHIFLERLPKAGVTTNEEVFVEELLSRGFHFDQKAYELHILGLCKTNKVLKAIDILDDMMAADMFPCTDVSVPLIPVLCKVGRYDTAITLKEMGTLEPSVSSLRMFGALIQGFCVTGKVRETFTLLRNMFSKGLSPDNDIYNLVIQGHCKVKNLKEVSELLGFMVKNNFSLSILSYRKFVHLLCMEGRNLMALHLKDFMLKCIESHDRVIYNILIFYLLRSGNGLLVGTILDELQEKKLSLDEFTYNFLVYGFSRCHDFTRSTYFLFTMISQEIRPNNRNFKRVISHLCDVGDLEKALELSREMELRGWFHGSVVQNAILNALISRGKLQEAELFLDRMVEKCLIPKHVDYNNIIKQFCQHGRLSKAVDLINTMLRKGNIPNSTAYDSVIQCCCSCHKLEEAMDFHTEMLDRGLKPSPRTWEELVFCFCRNGQLTEAERLLISMSWKGETPSKDAYLFVLNRYRLENNLEKASETMRAMQQRGYQLDFETQWSLISNLNDANANAKNDDNNKRFLSTLLSKSGFSQGLIP